MSYWNKKGKYEKQYQMMWQKYVPREGAMLTDNDTANNAIIALIKASKKYYRIFNDGDPAFGLTKSNMNTHNRERIAEVADRAVEKVILRAWKATKHATLPIVKVKEDIWHKK